MVKRFLVFGVLLTLAGMAVISNLVSAGPSSHTVAPQLTPQYQEFTAMIEHEANFIHDWLGIALGENAACAEECNKDRSFDNIVPLLSDRCNRLDPQAQMKFMHYDPAVHGGKLKALAASCATIQSSIAELGEPRQTPAWVQRAKQAKNALASEVSK